MQVSWLLAKTWDTHSKLPGNLQKVPEALGTASGGRVGSGPQEGLLSIKLVDEMEFQ